MNPPKTQLQEVLYFLLTRKNITVKQMMSDTGILNIKARINELRNKHFLPIQTDMIEVKNKFGRKCSFGQWSLDNKEIGILTYNKLQNDTPQNRNVL